MAVLKIRNEKGEMEEVLAIRGEAGKDGYTPIKGVDYFDGKDGAAGKDGKQGEKGEAGYTPVKGVDYYTDAEKQELINELGRTETTPDYIINATDEVIKDILALQGERTITFAAITDVHTNVGTAPYDAQTQESIKHTGMALDRVATQIKLDFITNLGDNIWGTNTDVELAKEEHLTLNRAMAQAYKDQTIFNLVGNHEANLYNACIPTAQIYNMYSKFSDYDEIGETAIRGYGYKDYKQYKLRVIGLNTSDYINNKGGYCLSDEQKLWFMSALDLSSKDNAEDWKILLLSHIPLDYPEGDSNTPADVSAILMAYQNGETASISAGSYNYAGKNKAQIIANIHGHIHNFSFGAMADNKIMRICTPNTCFYGNGNSSTGLDYLYQPNETYNKTAGTAEDTTITFYTIDLDNHIVYSTNYGAGYDRQISYYIEDGKPVWDLVNRTMVENYYAGKDDTKDFSESKYYYGVSPIGVINYTKVSDVVANGNDITFTCGADKNYGIGLPYHLNAGKTYTFSATASISTRVRKFEFNADGTYLGNLVYTESSTTTPSITFTAPEDESIWVMLLLDGGAANTTYTFTNISLVEN